MERYSFAERIEQISQVIRESEAAIAREIVCSVEDDVATWEHSRSRATLALHRDEAPPRLSLQLYTGEEQHPAPLQIGFYEADVVNMIAVPVAALLGGRSEG